MNPVRIKFWLKNGDFLETSIDFDDVMAINKAYGKVKAGVVRNENLKITISNITFHFDDIEKTMCSYYYPYMVFMQLKKMINIGLQKKQRMKLMKHYQKRK